MIRTKAFIRAKKISILELLLAMFFLSFIGSSFALSIYKTKKRQEFLSSVALVRQGLSWAQDLSLSLGIRLECRFEEREEGLAFYFFSESDLLPQQKQVYLKAIEEVFFLSKESTNNLPLRLDFFPSSGLKVEEGGFLCFQGQQQARFIALLSGPQDFTLESEVNFKEKAPKSDRYPHEMQS